MKTELLNSVYTLLETTTAKMNGQPGEEPGVSPSHVDAVKETKMKDPVVPKKTICIITLLVFFTFFAIIASVLFVSSSVEISKLRSELAARFENISDSISTQQSVNDQLRSKMNDNTQTNQDTAGFLGVGRVFPSCAAIPKLLPFQPSSGYYKIRSSNGSAITAYCDMTRSCGDITGGWMKVADLDMTDNTTQCPDYFELTTSPLRTCRISSIYGITCSPVMFSVGGVEYTKVCGRVKGYQVGRPNAFARYARHHLVLSSPSKINTPYVDGVSLTHGSSHGGSTSGHLLVQMMKMT